ncbi:MAG: hypothetical protein ACT4PU_08005 [Planctomycetota bacterium]
MNPESALPDVDPYDGRHPRDRAIEPEDPMLLTGEPVNGEPLFMLDSLIEEFAGQGWDKPHILRLFDSPFFQATWGLRQTLGLPLIEARIDTVLERCGVRRFRTAFNAAAAGPAACGHADVPEILHCAPPAAEGELLA